MDLAAEALAKVVAASMADIETETMAIAHAVEAIPAELILEIANTAVATTHISSLESATSVTRKAAGPQSTLWKNEDVPETALWCTQSSTAKIHQIQYTRHFSLTLKASELRMKRMLKTTTTSLRHSI